MHTPTSTPLPPSPPTPNLILTTSSTDQDYCSGVHIGYNPADIMSEIDKTTFNTASTDTTKALTRVMVLHPVAAGLAFIAFLLALGAGICGALLSAFVSLLTLIVVVVVLACDFVLFGIIKNHINDRSEDASGSHASFGAGIWTLVAALIVLVLGTLVVLSTCLSSRMHKKRARASKSADAGYAAGGTTTKRKFWQRRAKY